MSTKERLVESAKKLIAERGYNNTKVEDITNEAQVAKGTFYTYFKTKEDIFIELLENIFQKAEIALKELKFENNLKKDLHKFISFMYRGAFNDKGPFKIISNIFTNSELMTKVIMVAPKGELFKKASQNILRDCKDEVWEEVYSRLDYVLASLDEMIKVYMGSIFGMNEPCCVKLDEIDKLNEEELESHINFLTEFLYRALKK